MKLSYAGIQFRTFQSSDISQILELNKAAFDDQELFKQIVWDDSDFNNLDMYLQKNRGIFLVGFIDNELVAMGGVARYSDTEAEIRRMRIKPELQGNGVGKYLLELLEQEAKKLKYKAMVLDTTVNQVAAQKLYKSCGFHETHREKERWPLENIYYRKEV